MPKQKQSTKHKFPQYAIHLLHTKSQGLEKHKVGEDGPKDLKRYAKIMELLIEGKKCPGTVAIQISLCVGVWIFYSYT